MVVVCRHQSVVKMEDGRRRIKEEVWCMPCCLPTL
jgi:hypothetical protein